MITDHGDALLFTLQENEENENGRRRRDNHEDPAQIAEVSFVFGLSLQRRCGRSHRKCNQALGLRYLLIKIFVLVSRDMDRARRCDSRLGGGLGGQLFHSRWTILLVFLSVTAGVGYRARNLRRFFDRMCGGFGDAFGAIFRLIEQVLRYSDDLLFAIARFGSFQIADRKPAIPKAYLEFGGK